MAPRAARRRPVPATLEAAHIPAPVGGINSVAPGSAMPPLDCMQLFNLLGADNGLRTRSGSQEWCTGLTGAADNYVRSILPFTGSAANGASNKLFATTSTGIWDVTASSTTPTQVFAFATTSGKAGHGVSHAMVTSAGHFLVYCDEENGLIVYTETAGTWAAVTMGAGASQIAGVDPVNLVFATVFKGRLWFVEKNTASLWYMGTGALYGTATKFALGTKLRAGGPLVGVWNWTIDGGSGVDDALVAISGGGDVVIYKGTDPSSSSTFGIQGVWYAGGLPSGRQIASNYGGDMLLMTRMGILPLSRLVVGGSIEADQYSTAKIAPIFNTLMASKAALTGWSMRMHPEDNALIVTVPTAEGQPTTQLAMSLATRGWGRYRDLDIYSAEVYGGQFYFGTVDGTVCINTGEIDGVTLASPDAYSAIEWACLTRFNNLGNARHKRVQLIRPTVLSSGEVPAFDAEARFKFDTNEIAAVTPTTPSSGSWGSGVWDDAEWAGDYVGSQKVHGGAGIGTDVAIAIRGSATSRTVLVGIDVMFDQGGVL